MKESEYAADVREKDISLSSSLEPADDARVRFQNPFSQTVDVIDEIEIALREKNGIKMQVPVVYGQGRESAREKRRND